MFAMEMVDAGEAAEAFGFAFLVEAEHDDLFAVMVWPLLAVVLVVLQNHDLSICFIKD